MGCIILYLIITDACFSVDVCFHEDSKMVIDVDHIYN